MKVTSLISLWLDDYERQARLAPGVLALSPIAVVAVVYGLRSSPLTTVLSSLLFLAGGPLLLAESVRHQGKRVQAKIWALWRGKPTSRKLRLREPDQNTVRREAWRSAVSLVTGIELLSRRAEKGNPQRADETIELAVSKLRNRTRDAKKFLLVKKENRSYGFQRNLYGIRWFGRIVSVMTLVALFICLLWLYQSSGWRAIDYMRIVAVATSVAFLIFWLFFPSLNRVKSAADTYADEILNASMALAEEKSSG